MTVRLPISGAVLQFKHRHKRALSEELGRAGRSVQDLMADPFVAAPRLIQVGRAWEEAISIDDADALIDREVEGGVWFEVLCAAIFQAYWGRTVPPITIGGPATAEPPADDAPKKTDAEPARLERVS